jgi:hypothetical protein
MKLRFASVALAKEGFQYILSRCIVSYFSGANECVGGGTGGWTGTVEPINILMPIRNLQDHLRQLMMRGN